MKNTISLLVLFFGNALATFAFYCSEDKSYCIQLREDGRLALTKEQAVGHGMSEKVRVRYFGAYNLHCNNIDPVFDRVEENALLELERKKAMNNMKDFAATCYLLKNRQQCFKEQEQVKQAEIRKINAMKLENYIIKNALNEISEEISRKKMYIDRNSIHWVDRYYHSHGHTFYRYILTKNNSAAGDEHFTDGCWIKCSEALYNPYNQHCFEDVLHDKKEFTDARDGKIYKYVAIGRQIWMAENLNYHGEHGHIGICRNGRPENCERNGRLYNWSQARSVCPEGWRLPSAKEWQELINFVGGNEVAGRNLKAEGSGWEYHGCKYTAKNAHGEIIEYDECGDYGFNTYGDDWWTSTEDDGKHAYYRGIHQSYRNSAIKAGSKEKTEMLHVRCIASDELQAQ